MDATLSVPVGGKEADREIIPNRAQATLSQLHTHHNCIDNIIAVVFQSFDSLNDSKYMDSYQHSQLT